MKVQAIGPNGFGVYEVTLQSGNLHWSAALGDADGLLFPGFVDIHFHGAYGVDAMSAKAGEYADLLSALEKVGYETVYPTTVTASVSDVEDFLANLPDHPMVGGFHLEGPFISPEYPGAQPPPFIVDYATAPKGWDKVLDDPRLKVITMAPERPGALELIKRLSLMGVKVSLGHTNATFEECQAAHNAGAAHATHTFNAMRPFHHREAGTVGYVLTSSILTELIYDRLHVSKNSAKLLFQVKGAEDVIAVSDSTMATGMPSGSEITMWGLDVVVGEQEVRLKSNGSLAGSAITLADAFRNLVGDFGPETAIRACCLNPRRTMNLPEAKVWWRADLHGNLQERLELQA